MTAHWSDVMFGDCVRVRCVRLLDTKDPVWRTDCKHGEGWVPVAYSEGFQRAADMARAVRHLMERSK